MGSFHELRRADRPLPGDLLLVPPEPPGSANRRMRLTPETLRRKYGFRVGANNAPYLGSTDRALRSALCREPQTPRWLLVTDVRVSRPADEVDDLLALNSAAGAPDTSYPVVDYVYAYPVPGPLDAATLAATSLVHSTLEPSLRHDNRRLLPKSPLTAAMERLIESYDPQMQAVGSSETLYSQFRLTCSKLSDVGYRVSQFLDRNAEPMSFDPNAIPSSDASVYDFVSYTCYSMHRLEPNSGICIPMKFLRLNPGIRAYRLTGEAAEAAAAAVVRFAFSRARTELAGTAAYARAVGKCFDGMAESISSLHDRMPAPEQAGALDLTPELEGLRGAVGLPPPPAFDAPFRAAARVRAAALEVAA